MSDAIREAIEAIREAMIALAAMSDDGLERLQTPWSSGEWSYATDFKMVIRIPRLDEFRERPSNICTAGNIDTVVTGLTGPTWYDVPDIPPGPETCPKCHGARAVKCEACDGDGSVEWEFCHGGRTYDMVADCPVCGGDGVEKCRRCNGSGVLPEPGVAVGPALIDPRYLRLMALLPGCRLAPVDGWSPVVFEFDGGGGAVMPVRR